MEIFSKIKLFIFKFSFFEKLYFLENQFFKIVGVLFYRRMFAQFGEKSFIKKSCKIFNPQNISIGDNVRIEDGVTLYSVGRYENKLHDGKIIIGNNVYLNRGFNASCAELISIGDGVACGGNVFISDFDHGYDDVDIDVLNTNLTIKGPISIGRNSWLGQNVFVGSGVTIGEHCVVAANSVVVRDVPAYSVVAGIPARVIKIYNLDSKRWERVV